MMKLKGVRGSGGSSSSSSSAYVPVEANNSAGANTFARIVDLLGEGAIGGPANDSNWYKSTYYNGIPIQNPDGSFNFSGVTLDGRLGTNTQEYLPGFNGVENTIAVGAAVTIASGSISRTISDSDVDSCKVVISIPTLISQASNGDIKRAEIKLAVYVTPDNGAGTQQLVIDPETKGHIFEKYVSNYRHQFVISNLLQYGSAPWVITVARVTPDSSSVKLVNAFSWHSYTTVIETKLRYYGRSVVGHTINSAQFGDQVPTRSYKVDGISDMKIPSNFNPVTREYVGDWDGSFITGTTNNPAWIIYYLLTDPENGLGLTITEDMVDKWALYSCGTYCDELISVTTRAKQSDGTYADTVFSEPRFSFNGVIENRSQALEAITYLAGAMRAYPVWSDGQITFVQDRPVVAPARPVSPSNVSEDGFQYTGVPRRNRHTVVKVSWNNPDLFGKLDVVELVDEQGIINFGYNEMDFGAIGCTSRTEAIRRGRHALDTDANARELVTFTGGLEWADALPGELIAVQDPDYAAVVLEGRVVSGEITTLTLDKELTFQPGVTYTMLVQLAESAGEERVLTNDSETTAVLTWDTPLSAAPFIGAVLVVSASNVATRKFVLISVTEDEGAYTVTALEYDADKYARIDSGAVGAIPVNTTLLETTLSPPTNLVLEGFSYTVGDQGVRMFGIQMGWTPSIDPRVNQYEIRYRPSSGGWVYLATVNTPSYDWRDVPGDTYDISVRGVGVGPGSAWLEYTDFVLATALTNLAPPVSINTKEGGGLWSGKDCVIVIVPSTGSQYPSSYDDDVGDSNVDHYKIEVRKPDTTLLRSYDMPKGALEYPYFYTFNVEDHDGAPSRNLLFYAYSVDPFGNASSTYATVAASNPIPDMSGTTPVITDKYNYLKITWTVSSDNDISHYKVYLDENNPPTTLRDIVNHPDNFARIFGLDYDVDYFVQIEPYDGFGAGTKSVIPGAGNILKVPAINLDVELSNSFIRTDSDGNSSATLDKLYDGHYTTDGVSYTLSGTGKWIQYQYGIEDYFDRISIYTADSNAQVYVGYSVNGTDWLYLKTASGHVPDSEDYLTAATNEADAISNYWDLETGKNIALFPANVTAKFIRLHLVGTYTTTIYELIPSRILIGELAAITHLSVLTQRAGLINAGILQSSDYTTSQGVRFDLDEGSLEIRKSGVDKLIYDASTGALNIRGTLNFGDFTGYSWPASGGDGAHLSASGLLVGNYNDNKYFAVTAAGNITAPGLNITNGVAVFSGSVNVGNYTGYAWPASGGTGAHLSASGLLIGNANDGTYFQVTSAGNVYAPGLSIVSGSATFSGTVAADVITTNSIVGGATTETGFVEGTAGVQISSTGAVLILSTTVGAASIGALTIRTSGAHVTSSSSGPQIADFYVTTSDGDTFRSDPGNPIVNVDVYIEPNSTGNFTVNVYAQRGINAGSFYTLVYGKLLVISFKR